MTLKLYSNPQSRATITRWLLEELQQDYELITMAYDDGSMRSDAFLALNPMGKIPVVVDDGTVITDTVAIAIYLCDKYKHPVDLAPAVDDPQRAEYLRWIVFQASSIEPAMMQKGTGFETRREQAGWGTAELVIDTLENRVAKAEPFLLGERLTGADIILGASIAWALQFGLFPKSPVLAAYTERLTSRPAFARAMAPR